MFMTLHLTEKFSTCSVSNKHKKGLFFYFIYCSPGACNAGCCDAVEIADNIVSLFNLW